MLIVAVVLSGARRAGKGARRARGPHRSRDRRSAASEAGAWPRARGAAADALPAPAARPRCAGGRIAYCVATVARLHALVEHQARSLVLAALAGLASGGQTLLILMGGFDLGVAGFIVAGALAVTVLKDK